MKKVKKKLIGFGLHYDKANGHMRVILAAAVSNFLGLSSSLFIMVVYDRVVPNQAIESLIALTIGVLIALGFDF